MVSSLEHNSMKIMRPATRARAYQHFVSPEKGKAIQTVNSTDNNAFLSININEEYAMKDEQERAKYRRTSKEVFSWAMVSPTMKNFYKFTDLVAQSNVKFSKNDLK